MLDLKGMSVNTLQKQDKSDSRKQQQDLKAEEKTNDFFIIIINYLYQADSTLSVYFLFQLIKQLGIKPQTWLMGTGAVGWLCEFVVMQIYSLESRQGFP